MSRSSFLLLTLLLAAAGSTHAQTSAKDAAVTCKGPFKALLEASAAEKRGVMLYFNGQTLAGVVTACHDDGRIELKSQQYSRVIVLADRVDGAAM
ncbi:MAG TPA: hypothetical protein VLF18_15690 [Tahibacter sp.]|uniref:hypothetical protein n=1 Tax=Tahibacter sp. TaxID=2056211 RepID=UPI002BCC2BD4|nr:hypothetical protein [Tahibacter sp.]HSX61643.1 hypothetical protein [Tahibacter sp.]